MDVVTLKHGSGFKAIIYFVDIRRGVFDEHTSNWIGLLYIFNIL